MPNIDYTDALNHIKYEYSDGKDRVFISYQRESFDFVLKLSEYFENKGVKTWYAPRNIQLAGMWPEKLHEAIENCKCLLLLYTEQADKSKHVIREVSIADEYDKPILWLKLDETEPQSKVLKYFLKLVQTLEYNDDNLLFDSLCEVLSKDKIDFCSLKESLNITTESTADIQVEPWTKGIYAFDTPDDAAECIARVYFSIAKNNPNSTALLPTGRSAKKVFQAMLRLAATEYDACPFADAFLMNDTETFGVNMKHPTSRVKAINDYLINILAAMNRAPDESKLAFFGQNELDVEPEEMADMHLRNYPPSVHAVSISPYMEILGYDLGVHKEDIVTDGPRIIEVTEETKDYIDKKQKTRSIYTVGMKSALSAKTLLMIAFESNKSNAIERLFKEKMDPSVPITMLRKHQNAFLVVTKEIAEKAGIESHSIVNLSPKEAAECIVQKI